MLAKTHIVAGVGAAVVVAVLLHHPVTPSIVLLGGMGGLAPDLDHPQALLTRHLMGIRTMSGLARRTGLVHHRGIAHSLVALIVTTGILLPLLRHVVAHLIWAGGLALGHPAWVLGLWHLWGTGAMIGWGAGYASHMVADIFNTKGVQWFWPFNVWVHLPLPNITVGTWPETVFRWGIIGGILLWNPWLGVITASAGELIYRGVKSA